MWVVTSIGFFSVVQKPSDRGKGTLTVRARVLSDLITLRDHYLSSLGPIQENAGTDYRYRAVAPAEDVADAFARLINDIDYSNFKDEVSRQQGANRFATYHKVWDDLLEI